MKTILKLLCLTSISIAALSSVAFADEPPLCPSAFAEVAVHDDAKLCQIFDANDTSSSQSLSYFVALPPQQLIAFYQNAHPQLAVRSEFNQRTLLTMRDDMTRVAISVDENGAQVDILVL